MKNLVRLFVFTLSVLVFTSCGKEETTNLIHESNPQLRALANQGIFMRADDFNERGRWGCGIPCPGVTLPPIEQVCNKPNGMCQLAEVMGPIGTDIGTSLSNYVELKFISEQEIRLIRLGAAPINQEELQNIILADITEDYAQYLEEIVNYITHHVNIPKDTPFSDQDAQFLLNNAGLNGNSITVLEGEYKIIQSEEHPHGYFDLSIEIQ